MFALVSLMSLYLGTSNILSAFRVPFSEFEAMNWLLLLTGVILIFVGLACMWQAVIDAKNKNNDTKNKPK